MCSSRLLFRQMKKAAVSAYNREELTPVIRCSICTGEQVAGFQNKPTGQFEEVLLIRDAQDLESFRSHYGITEEIKHIY